jgi:iron complex outermembrane receptor protein
MQPPITAACRKPLRLALPPVLCALAYVFIFALSAAAQSQPASTGSLTGQVSNKATQSYLEGAVVTVTVAGGERVAVTSREGRYRIDGLPAGPVAVSVSYSGLDASEQRVAISAGSVATNNVELTSTIYQLEKYVVAGEREGTAKAESLQKAAPNVKSILASDTFGNFADGNVGELLQHVVGISATYNGPEVQKVSIRGIDSALNTVTMNGMQMATSQSANTGRQFEFEQASLANIERIEVTKAPTPDMPGSSLSGNVNLITKSAFDSSAGRSYNYTLGMTTQPHFSGFGSERWKQPIKGFGPSMNFAYSDVLGADRKLGITITGLFHSAPIGGAYIQGAYENKPDPGPAYNFSLIRSNVHGATNSRIAFGADLDYKWSEHTTLSLSTYYGFYHQNNDTRNHSLATARPTGGLAVLDTNGNRVSGGYVSPNYADGITRIFAGPSSTSTITSGTNDKSGHTEIFSPRIRQKFNNGLSIDYLTSFSRSATYYDVNNHEKYSSGPKGTVSARLSNIGWNVDRSQDLVWPTVTQTAGPDMLNLANYSNLTLTQFDKRGYDIVLAANIDARKEFTEGILTYVKGGLAFQEQRRNVWNQTRTFNYTGPDGILGNADDNADISKFLDLRPHPHDEIEYYKDRGGLAPWLDSYAIALDQKENPELWKENVQNSVATRLASDQRITERIQAAYLMGNLRFRNLDTLAGVRFETTDPSGEGARNYISPEEAARRAAWVGPVTDQEARRRARAQYATRMTNEGHYENVLPSVHFKYVFSDKLQARLSWSTGLGRPPFGSVIPSTTVDDTNMRVTTGNPDLKPQHSNSYDADIEYYFKPQGVLSVGFFRKDITDYIYTDTTGIIEAGQDNGFDGQYVGYRLTTSRNAGDAHVQGFEFNYAQQLSFLPGWSKGFGVFANYTDMKSEGVFGKTVQTTSQIPNFLTKFGNAGISYRGHGFDLRMMVNYRGRYLTAYNAVPGLAEYQKPRMLWSWKSRYTITRALSLFLDLENVFEAWLDDRYLGYEDRVNFQRTYHTKITFGITGRL